MTQKKQDNPLTEAINLADAAREEEIQAANRARVDAERKAARTDSIDVGASEVIEDIETLTDPWDIMEAEKAAKRKLRPKLEDEPSTKVLFAASDSYQFFIDVLVPDVTADGMRINKKVSYTIRLKKGDPIEGLPGSAGGCTKAINPGLATQFGIPWGELLNRIYEHGSYGSVAGFAFLDDERGSKALLDKMRRQAVKEGRVQMEALTEGVIRSDMALDGDRVY